MKPQDLEAAFRSVIIRVPIIIGNEVVNFALDNFKKQGFLGNSFQPWAKRKNPTRWGTVPPRNGRAILVDAGHLRRSIRITTVTQDAVGVGSDIPYAKTHNEGLRIGQIQTVSSFQRKGKKGTHTVKSHTRKVNVNIPQRQFLGDSPYLVAKIKRIVSAEIMKALR